MTQKGSAIVWVVIAILVILGLAYWASQRAGAPEAGRAERTPIPGNTLKVGVILPLTGDAAAYGTPISRGVQLAAEEINSAGGVSGKPVELIIQDGKCDGAEGNRAANKLINVDGVRFIIGGACSGETLGFTDLAEQNQVIVISPSATNPAITAAGDFVFRTAPSDAVQAVVAADYTYNTLGLRKAAIIHETTDYAQGLADVFDRRFKELGGETAALEKYNTGDTDFSAHSLRIKAADPDVVYVLPQAPAAGALIVSQLRQNGVGAQVVGAEVLGSQAIVNEYGAIFEGMVATEPYYNQEAEKARAYLAKYKASHNEDPEFPFYSAGGYSDLYLIASAVEEVGYDTAAVRDYLYGLQNWDHALGTISFDENGDVATAYAIKRVKDGILELADVITP